MRWEGEAAGEDQEAYGGEGFHDWEFAFCTVILYGMFRLEVTGSLPIMHSYLR